MMKTSGSMMAALYCRLPSRRLRATSCDSCNPTKLPAFLSLPLLPRTNRATSLPTIPAGDDAEEQATFVREHLGPAFRDAHLKTKIMIFDHNWT